MRMNLSEAARAAIRDDLGPERVLRVAFAGGCGALGFRLSTPRRGNADDLRLELPEITLFLDQRAAAELDGATLDYHEELGFVLDHPSWGLSC